LRDLLASPQPSTSEFLIAICISFIAIIAFTYVDINIFNTYVLPDIEGNFDAEDQLAIGNTYWETLNGIIGFVGGTVFVIRLALGKLAGAKTTGMLFLVSFVWALGIVILFYFGTLDTLYYVIDGREIPDTLPHLNGIGLFQFFEGDVTGENLIMLNLAGITVLVLFWYALIHHHKKGTLKKLGLT